MGAACATASLRHWDSPTKKGYVGFDVYVSQENKKKVPVSPLLPHLLSQHLSLAPWSNLLCQVTVISPTWKETVLRPN